MQIIEVEVDKLIPYVNNPRINDDAVDYVAASIKEFGFKVPIIVDKENVIVAGHTRLKAAKKLGLTTVPCIKADDLTEQQVKAFRLADNKVSELALWDIEKLDIELEAIDLEMMNFGFADIPEEKSEADEQEEYEQKKKEFEERMASGELSEDSEEYQDFLKKFEPKKTTDDCYTPEKVYEAVADYVVETYNKKKSDFVRPFYPNGDYQKEKYPKGCVVVDNPPFSILSEIIRFYERNAIDFFLFAPALTIFSSASANFCVIGAGGQIIYENGANVSTSFVTSLEDKGIRAKSEPKLHAMIAKAVEETQKEKHKEIPKYAYPNEVLTSTMLSRYSKYGVDFCLTKEESVSIDALEEQKKKGKAIYGKGYLISEKAAAEKWTLSPKELEIVRSLSKSGGV